MTRTQPLKDTKTTPSTPLLLSTPVLVCAGLAAVIFFIFNLYQQGYQTYYYYENTHPLNNVNVYWEGAKQFLHGTNPYLHAVPVENNTLNFSYPPGSLPFFIPFYFLPRLLGSILFNAISAAAVYWSTLIVLRHLNVAFAARWATVLFPFFLLIDPVFSALHFNDLTVVIMALVLTDLLWPTFDASPRPRFLPRGLLIGIAATLKLTPLVFVIYLAARREWKTLGWVGIGGGVPLAFVAAINPQAVGYFFSTRVPELLGTASVNRSTNESLHAFAARFVPEAGQGFINTILIAAIIVLGVAAIIRLRRSGADLAAILAAAFLGLLAAPMSWPQHFAWEIPLVILCALCAWRQASYLLALLGGAWLSITTAYVPHMQIINEASSTAQDMSVFSLAQSAEMFLSIATLALLALKPERFALKDSQPCAPRSTAPRSTAPEPNTPGSATPKPSAPELSARAKIAAFVTNPVVLACATITTLFWNILSRFEAVGYSTYKADYRIAEDMQTFIGGATRYAEHVNMYADKILLSNGTELAFIYPPFAAFLFQPLRLLPASCVEGVVALGNTALLYWILLLTFRRINWPAPAHLAWVAMPLVWWLEPVRTTFFFGQVGILLMALVVTDMWWDNPRVRRYLPRGTFTAAAAAIKLTPAVFILYFLCKKDIRAVINFAAAFIFFTALAAVPNWQATWEFYTHYVMHINDQVDFGQSYNLSLRAVAERFLPPSIRNPVWTAAVLATTALLALVIRRLTARGEDTLALIATALLGLLISPISWQHHWIWIIAMLPVIAVTAYRTRNTWMLLCIPLYLGIGVIFIPDTQIRFYLIENRGLVWTDFVQSATVWWGLFLTGVLSKHVRLFKHTTSKNLEPRAINTSVHSAF